MKSAPARRRAGYQRDEGAVPRPPPPRPATRGRLSGRELPLSLGYAGFLSNCHAGSVGAARARRSAQINRYPVTLYDLSFKSITFQPLNNRCVNSKFLNPSKSTTRKVDGAKSIENNKPSTSTDPTMVGYALGRFDDAADFKGLLRDGIITTLFLTDFKKRRRFSIRFASLGPLPRALRLTRRRKRAQLPLFGEHYPIHEPMNNEACVKTKHARKNVYKAPFAFLPADNRAPSLFTEFQPLLVVVVVVGRASEPYGGSST
ncbi:hypothetical protein EVAR_61321_1 [Eumeta japonica]|uniref:Uncharacterized protein n=1 Tax=Eumeta variegata TaxID=151549 RepID=A0A4C1Y0X7_EUMVA|nr:hypothetical protein EVAR_61321_1 [Eumeta japonica]